MGLTKHYARANKPIKWINKNHLTDEMSDEEFKKEIDKIMLTRDIKKYGRDGSIEVWERTVKYRKLAFLLKVIRYYQIGVPLNEISGMNKIGKWVVLEYPDAMKGIVDFVQTDMGKSEFLWQDTLHTWNDGQSLKNMVKVMKHFGKCDIDWWLDKAEGELKENNTSKLDKFNEIWGVEKVHERLKNE